MDIASNLTALKKQIPAHITIVAVSKTKPENDIMQAYNSGHKIFGENKVQELTSKHESLPRDIEWHMIGHLQRNKVKYIAPFVNLIQSVDSLRLLTEINKQALKNNRVIDCLLQVHIAKEETKFGFTEEEILDMLSGDTFKNLRNISIKGLMGMATFTDDKQLVRSEFRELNRVFTLLKKDYFLDNPAFKEISMGMSDDYMLAIEEGSTIVRIGTSIFGRRNYDKCTISKT
jgi:hypothetical protein